MGNVLREDFRSAHVLHLKAVCRLQFILSPDLVPVYSLAQAVLDTEGNFLTLSSCDTLVQQLQVGGLDLISFGLAAFKNWEKDICDPNISDLRGSSSKKLRPQCLQARQWYPNDFARMH